MAPFPDEKPAFDPAIQTEEISFKPREMVDCDGCNRANPPNRLNCIYCGAALAISPDVAAGVTPSLRKLESFERGFNVVVTKVQTTDHIVKIGRLLSSEPASFLAILEAKTPLPLARVESETDAECLLSRLNELGVISQVVTDVDLAAERPPIRLSGIDLGAESLTLTDFNTGRTTTIPKTDLVLIVTGTITHARIDSLEKKRRRGKQTKVLEESSTTSDEQLVDLYSSQDPIGFRVHLTGFDFSCLGARKGMLAAENMRLLAALLVDTCPNAKLVNNYDSIRDELGDVWGVESRKDTKGLLRIRVGKHEFGSVASTNNLLQFTKYSRLQWQLL
jgi:hypothetical protein